VCLQPDPILFRFENQHYLLTLCYARRTACESSPLRDRPTRLSGPRPWAGQAARRVRNVATLQWEPSAMGHLGISVHARAPAIECSNRGQVIWLVLIGKRALCNRMSLVNDVTPPPNGASHDQRATTRTSVANLLAVKSQPGLFGVTPVAPGRLAAPPVEYIASRQASGAC